MSGKILALDTSTENCSVALINGEQLFTRSEVAPRDHTKKILPMVDDVLMEAALSLGDLDAIAFGQGPGSFTGVRIGIGIAQGLAFGAHLPMIGISTLAAMAQGVYRVHQSSYVLAAIDARMNEIYWGQYYRNDIGEWHLVRHSDGRGECVLSPEDVVERVDESEYEWMQAGTGWQTYQTNLEALPLSSCSSSILYPEAQDMVILAQQEWRKGNTTEAASATPTYLRDTVTWKKLPGRE